MSRDQHQNAELGTLHTRRHTNKHIFFFFNKYSTNNILIIINITHVVLVMNK